MLIGEAFARALARKDFERVEALLDPAVDFRGMTPRLTWEAGDARSVVADILTSWFEESDHIEELVELEVSHVGDRERVGYRFRGRNEDGPFLVEQQAYLEHDGERITWMRVLCSGTVAPVE
jgi:hypothetical protein